MSSASSHPHYLTPSYIFKVLAVTHPTPHFAFKPPYTIHSCHYSRVQSSTHDSGCFYFPHLSFTTWGPSPAPSFEAAGSGWIPGPQSEWLLFLFFCGISSVPTGHSLPPFSAFPQGQMWNSHISGTAFVETGTKEGIEPTANCRRGQQFSEHKEVVDVVSTAPVLTHHSHGKLCWCSRCNCILAPKLCPSK